MALAFKDALVDFFNSLVPVSLRERRATENMEYVRIRALSVMLVLMLVLAIPGAVSTIIGQLMSRPDFALSDWSSVILLLVFGIQAVLFYRFHNYWLSALAFTSIYLLLVVILVIMSGGDHSPMKVMLLTCPFMSFMISGKHEGIQTSILVAVIGVVLAFLQSIRFEPPDIFGEENDYAIFCADWMISITTIIFAMMVYETALKGGGDAMLRVRERFLKVILLATIILILLATVPLIGWFWLFNIPTSDFLMQKVITFVVLSLFVVQFVLFFRFKNYGLSGFLFANSYFLVIMIMIIASGGYDSPLKFFLLTCPLVASVIGGVRDGIQNGVFVAIAGLAFATLKKLDFEFLNIFTDPNHPYLVFGANWLVILGIIMTCILVYETELQRQESV